MQNGTAGGRCPLCKILLRLEICAFKIYCGNISVILSHRFLFLKPHTIIYTMKSVVMAVLVLLGLASVTHAQNTGKYTISGYVRDSVTGEELIGVTMKVAEIPSAGAVTNVYGFYSITIPAGAYTITGQYMGYVVKAEKVNLLQNTKVDFKLLEQTQLLQRIMVSPPKGRIRILPRRRWVWKNYP